MLYKKVVSFFASRKGNSGGVNSPVRAFKAVGTQFLYNVPKALICTKDGNRLIDYINSWGPMILGHAFEPVVQAVIEKAKLGSLVCQQNWRLKLLL
jgi:glutamate-1-semialdehyde 2,1-aminomutase